MKWKIRLTYASLECEYAVWQLLISVYASKRNTHTHTHRTYRSIYGDNNNNNTTKKDASWCFKLHSKVNNKVDIHSVGRMIKMRKIERFYRCVYVRTRRVCCLMGHSNQFGGVLFFFSLRLHKTNIFYIIYAMLSIQRFTPKNPGRTFDGNCLRCKRVCNIEHYYYIPFHLAVQNVQCNRWKFRRKWNVAARVVGSRANKGK